MDYKFKGAERDEDFGTIYATVPAIAGTYLCYAFKDGTSHRELVVAWGIVANGVPVPITLDGPDGGTSQPNQFVLFPDGRCGRYEGSWENEESAIAELGKFET